MQKTLSITRPGVTSRLYNEIDTRLTDAKSSGHLDYVLDGAVVAIFLACVAENQPQLPEDMRDVMMIPWNLAMKSRAKLKNEVAELANLKKELAKI